MKSQLCEGICQWEMYGLYRYDHV